MVTSNNWAALRAVLADAIDAFGRPRQVLPRKVITPDVRGMEVDAGRRTIIDAGLRPETVQETRNPEPVMGRVREQSPMPGTRVRRRSTVTLFVVHPERRPG
jgi:beta-lactam-binding protein with PASTA domain